METTTPGVLPNIVSNIFVHEKSLDMTPNMSMIINSTFAKSRFVYSIPEYNVSHPIITSIDYDSSTTSAMDFKRGRDFDRSRPRARRPRMKLRKFLATMEKNVMPTAYTIGIVGCFILIPVFTCTPLKASALSHYLTAIGVADFLYLFSQMVVWISTRGYRFSNVIGVCQLTMFTLRLSNFLGTWYLLAAHLERCLVHFGSRKARVWCSTFRTKCIILGIFIFSLVGFLHYIWTHLVVEENGRAKCSVMPESVKHVLKLNTIEIVVSSFLPMIMILPMDLALIMSLVIKRYRAVGVRMIKSNNNNSRSSSSSGSGNPRDCQEERSDGYVLARRRRSKSPSTRSGDSAPPPAQFDLSREKSWATLVVVISGLLFICFILPSSVYRGRLLFNNHFPDDMSYMMLTERLQKFNNVYKCYLYILLLRGFRHGILYFRHCRRKRKVCENSQQETEV